MTTMFALYCCYHLAELCRWKQLQSTNSWPTTDSNTPQMRCGTIDCFDCYVHHAGQVLHDCSWYGVWCTPCQVLQRVCFLRKVYPCQLPWLRRHHVLQAGTPYLSPFEIFSKCHSLYSSYLSNNRHVCTRFNAFFMPIPDLVTVFIFVLFCFNLWHLYSEWKRLT